MQFQIHEPMEKIFRLDLLKSSCQYAEEQCTCWNVINNDGHVFIAVDMDGGVVIDAMEESMLALNCYSGGGSNNLDALTHCLTNNRHQNSNG